MQLVVFQSISTLFLSLNKAMSLSSRWTRTRSAVSPSPWWWSTSAPWFRARPAPWRRRTRSSTRSKRATESCRRWSPPSWHRTAPRGWTGTASGSNVAWPYGKHHLCGYFLSINLPAIHMFQGSVCIVRLVILHVCKSPGHKVKTVHG